MFRPNDEDAASALPRLTEGDLVDGTSNFFCGTVDPGDAEKFAEFVCGTNDGDVSEKPIGFACGADDPGPAGKTHEFTCGTPEPTVEKQAAVTFGMAPGENPVSTRFDWVATLLERWSWSNFFHHHEQTPATEQNAVSNFWGAPQQAQSSTATWRNIGVAAQEASQHFTTDAFVPELADAGVIASPSMNGGPLADAQAPFSQSFVTNALQADISGAFSASAASSETPIWGETSLSSFVPEDSDGSLHGIWTAMDTAGVYGIAGYWHASTFTPQFFANDWLGEIMSGGASWTAHTDQYPASIEPSGPLTISANSFFG